jgi:hypothetical protein
MTNDILIHYKDGNIEERKQNSVMITALIYDHMNSRNAN